MKKLGISLIVIFTVQAVLLIVFSSDIPEVLVTVFAFFPPVLIPLGATLISINAKEETRNKVKRIYFFISLGLVIAGLISKYFHLPAAGMELLTGTVWYCFAYAPLQLKFKYLKWEPFSGSKLETIGLSFLDFLAVNLVLIGILFKIFLWPGANALMISGGVILAMGILFWNFRFKKEVVRRKESEDLLSKQHKDITDSINYAKRLQEAILPSFEEVNKHLPNNFIYFQPKDVVSGDFYWFEHVNGVSYIAAADSTGHGVPGALVSIVCSNALTRSVKEFGITDPAKILDKTRELVIETFSKSGGQVKDGMDVVLCAFHKNKVVFCGANNPLWIVRKTELITEKQKETRGTIIQDDMALIEFKGNRQPIGLFDGMKPFAQKEIELHPDDSCYFFTDGFADQFGGEKEKKFMYKPFKKCILEMQSKPIKEHSDLLRQTFEDWRGDFEQIDDVCIVGVRL